jgi:hypothetical protein
LTLPILTCNNKAHTFARDPQKTRALQLLLLLKAQAQHVSTATSGSMLQLLSLHHPIINQKAARLLPR